MTDALGGVSRWHYNELGQLDEEPDAKGQRTVHFYNVLNQRIKTQYADGTSTQTEYDALGRKVATIDELGARTEFSYDAAGHLIKVHDALGHDTQYVYDQNGCKTQYVDALGHADYHEPWNGHCWAYRTWIRGWQEQSVYFDSKGRETSKYLTYNGGTLLWKKLTTYTSVDTVAGYQYDDNPRRL